jgi:hypothetical protein
LIPSKERKNEGDGREDKGKYKRKFKKKELGCCSCFLHRTPLLHLFC